MTDVASPQGWRLRIKHVDRVHVRRHRARLLQRGPDDAADLRRADHCSGQVECTPGATTWRYWDYWGTQVTVFDLQRPHQQLEVQRHERGRDVPGTPAAGAPRWTGRSRRRRRRWFELIAPTRLTAVDGSSSRRTRGGGRPDPLSAALAVAGWVRETVAYVRGATGVRTSAQEAYAQRAGVCQDIAHLTVGMLRAIGLPARYVSGYLHPSRRRRSASPSKARATPGWSSGSAVGGVGPDERRQPAERHVMVARGRDYDDVAPLKGVYRGAPRRLSAWVSRSPDWHE